MVVVERPRSRESAGGMAAIHVVPVVAAAGGQGQPRDDFALKLCVTAVDGREVSERHRPGVIESLRIGADRRSPMLCAEPDVDEGRDGPGSLVLLANAARDATKRTDESTPAR